MSRFRSLGREDNVLLVTHPSGAVAIRTLLPGDAIVDFDRAETRFHRGLKLARVLGRGSKVSIGTYTDAKATQFSPAWEEVVA